jgi:hypothetical protein
MLAAGKWFQAIVCHGLRSRREKGNWLLGEIHRTRTGEEDRNIDHEYHRKSSCMHQFTGACNVNDYAGFGTLIGASSSSNIG